MCENEETEICWWWWQRSKNVSLFFLFPKTSPNRYMLVLVARGLRRACWVNWWWLGRGCSLLSLDEDDLRKPLYKMWHRWGSTERGEGRDIKSLYGHWQIEWALFIQGADDEDSVNLNKWKKRLISVGIFCLWMGWEVGFKAVTDIVQRKGAFSHG